MRLLANTVLVIATAGLLAGCKLGSEVGSGPLLLPLNVSSGYSEYLSQPYPLAFAVSEDGRAYGYVYCEVAGCMRGGTHQYKATENCLAYSNGTPCKIYARKRNVVWDGHVSAQRIGGSPNVNATNTGICSLAITTKDGDPFWDGRITSQEAVSEARRRDLTPEKCAEILGRT